MTRADDYVEHATDALCEAIEQIDAAATLPIAEDRTRARLARALGQARNAVSRAQHDLQAHRTRETAREDRSAAETYLRDLMSPRGEYPAMTVVVLPLPMEEARIGLETIADPRFQNDFTMWVTRFNNEERPASRLHYLMDVPGGLSGNVEGNRFVFVSFPNGAREPSQTGVLYPTGALKFEQRLYDWQTPPKFTTVYLLDALRNTIKFARRVYDELRIGFRAIAVQAGLNHINGFELVVPTAFGGQSARLQTSEVDNIFAPEQPAIISADQLEGAVNRVALQVEQSLLSYYRLDP
jgi:hypothetical protein